MPSRKNGRFSGRNVSKLVRFRITWSASTCAKSGLNAASSVTSLARCHLRFRPAEPNSLNPLRQHGLVAVGPARVADAERNQLQRAAALQPAQLVQPPEVRDRRGDVTREVGPQIGLLASGDEARALKAPALDGLAAVEAQHADRNADLGGPAARAMRRLALPVLVPLPRVRRLVDDLPVGDRPRDVDRELIGALALVARVDQDPDPLALRVAIAPGELLDDRRVDLVAVEAEVDRVLVVQHAHLRPLGRLAAVERRLLREGVGRGRRLPDGVVETAVDQRRLRGANGGQVRDRPRFGFGGSTSARRRAATREGSSNKGQRRGHDTGARMRPRK